MTQFKQRLDPKVILGQLTLKAFTDTDRERLFQAVRASSTELRPFLPWCHPKYSRREALTWIQFAQATWRGRTQYAFLIEERATGALIGSVGLDSPTHDGAANLGYWIRSDCTGRGYASQAARALATLGLQQLELKQVLIKMSTHNTASRQVAIKTGAQFLREEKDGLTLHDAKHDALVYALTRPSIELMA